LQRDAKQAEGLELARTLQLAGIDGAQASGLDQGNDLLRRSSRQPASSLCAISPATSVPAKVVLNAFTTRLRGSRLAISSAALLPGAVTRPS
jgi:hypothetical protein